MLWQKWCIAEGKLLFCRELLSWPSFLFFSWVLWASLYLELFVCVCVCVCTAPLSYISLHSTTMLSSHTEALFKGFIGLFYCSSCYFFLFIGMGARMPLCARHTNRVNYCADHLNWVCMWWMNTYIYGGMILWDPSLGTDLYSGA